jgi:hypothetical protein
MLTILREFSVVSPTVKPFYGLLPPGFLMAPLLRHRSRRHTPVALAPDPPRTRHNGKFFAHYAGPANYRISFRITIPVTIKTMMIVGTNQNGAVTHHHDQLMTPQSLRTTNAMPSNPMILVPPAYVAELSFLT